MSEERSTDPKEVRLDIDIALKRILVEMAHIRENLSAGPEMRVMASAVALLAVVVGEQEKNFRALEQEIDFRREGARDR
jgi:hypothetical protein